MTAHLALGGTGFLASAFAGPHDRIPFFVTFALYLLGFLAFVVYGAGRKAGVARAATALMALGVVVHTVAIALRWQESGHVPFSNMYEYANIMAWMAVVSYLVIMWRYNKPIIGLVVSPLVVALIVSASLLPKDVTTQLVPALQSYWLPIHVVLAALGEGAFLVATAVSVMYLIVEKRTATGGRAGSVTPETLEEINYKALSIGYPLFTVGALFAGAIWAYTAWGSFWSWDPKEVGALVVWLFYTLYLHGRYNHGWRGRKAAWMSVIGFIMILASFFGNLILGGQHAYG